MPKQILHKRSHDLKDGMTKLPDASQLSNGEIAINYNTNNEKLIIKNDSNEIVTFSSDKQNDNKLNILANSILKVNTNCGLDDNMNYIPKNDLLKNSNSINESVEIIADNLNIETSDFVSKTELNDGLNTKQDKGDYALRSELLDIKYVEGTSDKNGYITDEIAPSGDNILIISRMYLHPTLNMWCHCPSYETATNGDKIITGGIKYGVAVVVGGTEAQTFPNCRYRTYYIELKI